MATLRHIAEITHIGGILLYAAVATYFIGFFAAVELALTKLPT